MDNYGDTKGYKGIEKDKFLTLFKEMTNEGGT